MRKLAIMLIALVMVSTASAVIFVAAPAGVKGTGPKTITSGTYKTVGYSAKEWDTKCYWQVGQGNICMQGGMIWNPAAKRFRRHEMSQKQTDISGPVMRAGARSQVKVTGSGPQTMMRKVSSDRFAYQTQEED